MIGLASTYQDKELQKNQSGGSQNLGQSLGRSVGGAQQPATGSSQMTQPKTAAGYADRAKELAQSMPQYTPGDNVVSAKNYLDQVIAQKPGAYQGKYTGQVSALYDRIMNRGPFSYNQNSDAMYQMYAQRYRNAGMRNMYDTTAQGAAKTGGYGNSYAQTAGQSAYNASMGQLADQIPALQSQALDRYNTESQNLQNLYRTASQAEQTDYNRHQDQIGLWQNEREWAAGEYDRQYANDYNNYQNSMSMAQNMIGMEREDRQNAMAQAQQQANMYIQAGIMPSADILQAAGYDSKTARELVKKYR